MGRKTILVVDDSCVLRKLLSSALCPQGFAVMSAKDGAEAVAMLSDRASVDVIITDLHMPKLDGLGLIRHVRSLPQHSTTPVFVLTGGAEDIEKQQAKTLGATAWIIKPFDTAKLAAAIRQVLH